MRKLLVVLFFFAAAGVFGQQKYALVIGNGSYTNFGALRNAVNDANDMADALKGLGFNVDKVINGNLNQMESAAVKLRNQLGANANAYGFFFYAGHGVQWQGENYLIPVDANIPDSDFLRQRAVSVQSILDMLNKTHNALNIVVLDACRDFPAVWTRSADRGLAVVHPPTDSIIMYATGAGRTASDGTGRNGLFTTQLLTHLKTPGIEVNELFRRTMSDVARASNNEQRPALYTDFANLAYLGSRPSAATPQPAPKPWPAPVIPPTPAPAPAPAPVTPAYVPERPVEPEMVRIQGGTFTMGSPMNESDRLEREGPQRQVKVSTFYMGKYEVTQKEYQEVMGTNPSYFKGDNLPVEQVSWFNAAEYCNARSLKEGLKPAYKISGSGDNQTVSWNRSANGYRLPTEAEWEYACRAGTINTYNTGPSITNDTGWYDANSGNTTRLVGQKPANAWGLYDMHGNVWEWCWDWYGDYPKTAQTDPAGASSGPYRVRRGGSWFNPAQYARSACRDAIYPNYRYGNQGFRVVCKGK
jgi:formylglycine-generating enzyme required for sulfatase activity